MIEKTSVPELYGYYDFWDNDRREEKYHYFAWVMDIITPDRAKNIILPVPTHNFDDGTVTNVEMSLYERWEEEVLFCNDIYQDFTDFFIKANIPGYSENPVYFVRSKDGTWYSIDTTEINTKGKLEI